MLDSSIFQLVNKLSLSYELSLSIGQSLNLEEMLQNFIKTLVRKTSALRGVVWIVDNDMIRFGSGAGFGIRDIDHTKAPSCIKTILPDLMTEEVITLNQDEHCFQSFCYSKMGREKEILLIPINNTLVIHLAYGRTNVVEEGIADIIKTLRPKLYNAVSACINYQKLLAYERKEKDRLEVQLIQSEERYRLLTENALAGVFLIQNNVLCYANPKFAEIFGYKTDELLKSFTFENLVITSDKTKVSQWQNTVISNGSADSKLIFCARRKDGSVIVCECMGTKTVYSSESAIVGTLIDITERKRAESKLQYLADHDSLTQLYNRAYFEKLLATYQKENNLFPITIIMCDLNDFKTINDSYGHQTGDMLLKQTAMLLKGSLRKDDILVRYGGDEFIVLLPNTPNTVGNALVQRIYGTIANYNESVNKKLRVSMSIGVATANSYAELEDAINKADSNMYTNKAASLSGLTGRFIKTLIEVLSARNLETKGHTLRVKDLAISIGKAYGLNEQALSALSLLAMVHDIGKIGIPDSILLKPGRLTDSEYQIMKEHVMIGYNIARTLTELEGIAHLILHHHERWDGKGYPFGLKELQIPLICRILAIADTYDAITNNRPYRQALSKEEALAEIRACSGTHFDPNIVNIFVQLLS